MITKNGDIWTYHSEGGWIIVTTNIGWKKDGTNPMGAGLAKTAADKYPELPEWYGKKCQKFRSDIGTLPYKKGRLFLFPTKELANQPWMSWNQDSSLSLIQKSTIQLALWVNLLENEGHKFIKPIGVPLVGCQNGNLKPKQVKPILEKHLDQRFVLFER